MNVELQRQHAAHRERQARLNGGARPACRAIPAPAVRSAIVDGRRERHDEEERLCRAQLVYQHRIRVACIAQAFAEERTQVRGKISAALLDALCDITRRETDALLGEREFYLLELSGAFS